MTDILATVIMVAIAVVILAILIFVLKNGVKLLINAICGVIILFVYQWLVPGVISFLPALGNLSVAQVVVCAVGGIPGAIIVIILAFFGIHI